MFVYRFIIITILIFIIQVVIFDRFGSKKIEYKRYFSKEYVFEGETVFMVEEVYNKKLLPVPWLKLESKISENLMFGSDSENLQVRHESLHESIFTLMPYTKITRKHSVLCSQRGEYILSNVYMTSGSLFGGGSSTKEIGTDSRIVVYPKIEKLNDLPIKHHNILGDFMLKRWLVKDPFLITGTNNYTYNEPLNLINWKATAKTNSLRVHNLGFSSDHKIMLLMNVDLSEEQWTYPAESEIVENIFRICASFVYLAISNGIEIGFGTNASCYFNESVPQKRPFAGNEQLHKILSSMSISKLKRYLAFHTFLKNEVDTDPSNIDYLIISWYDSTLIHNQIDQLIRLGNSVMLLTRKDLMIVEKSS